MGRVITFSSYGVVLVVFGAALYAIGAGYNAVSSSLISSLLHRSSRKPEVVEPSPKPTAPG